MGLLAGDGQRAVKVLTQKQKEDYQKVKATLLDAYQVAPERYRQKFFNHGYNGTNYNAGMAAQMNLERWVDPAESLGLNC